MKENEPVGKAVYKAIAAVQRDMAAIGISKDSKNQQQGFMFRGIDAVYNALAPLLAEHKLCIIPRCQSRVQTERESKSGGALFSVVLDVEYDVVSGEDGSCHVARLPAEAMDSADKATNKAMSAAYKYLCLQMFCIPTESESPDADKESHEVKGKPQGYAEQLLVSKVKAIVPTSNPQFVTIHTTEDMKLGTGDEALIQIASIVIKTGEDVRFHYAVNGRFNDLVAIERRAAATAPAPAPAERTGPVPKHDPHKMAPMAPGAGNVTVTGVVTSEGKPNELGFISWTLDNQQREDGAEMKFTAKDAEIAKVMSHSLESKTRVKMEYKPAKSEKFACAIIRAVPEFDEVPF